MSGSMKFHEELWEYTPTIQKFHLSGTCESLWMSVIKGFAIIQIFLKSFNIYNPLTHVCYGVGEATSGVQGGNMMAPFSSINVDFSCMVSWSNVFTLRTEYHWPCLHWTTINTLELVIEINSVNTGNMQSINECRIHAKLRLDSREQARLCNGYSVTNHIHVINLATKNHPSFIDYEEEWHFNFQVMQEQEAGCNESYIWSL